MMNINIENLNAFKVKFLLLLLFVFGGINIETIAGNYTNGFVKGKEKHDSIMCAAVGDSIHRIIKNARCITAVAKYTDADGNKVSKTVILKHREKEMARQIVLSDDYYMKNDTVYGQFFPNFTLTFKCAKGRTINTNFDFGLKKWNICDKKGRMCFVFNVADDRMLILASSIFRTNEFFNSLLNLKKK